MNIHQLPASSLIELNMGPLYRMPLRDWMIPPRLEVIDFGNVFDYPIEHLAWPASMKKIVLPKHYTHTIHNLVISDAFESLTIGGVEKFIRY